VQAYCTLSGVQINSVSLSLISFRKFITGDKKMSFVDNPKEENRRLTLVN